MPEMRTEAVFACPKCGESPFILYARQNRPNGPWQNVLWPAKPGIAPPEDPHHIACPRCKVDCERKAP